MSEPETTPDALSIQCPDCGINWWLFPPATVHGSDGKLRRCIECKRIYNSEGVNVSHAALIRAGEGDGIL